MSGMHSKTLNAVNPMQRTRLPLSPASGMAWVADRACGPRPGETWSREQWAEHDRMWFPTSSRDPREALSVCDSCPVLRDCAATAVKHDGGGVVGGVTVPEYHDRAGRERARRALRRAAEPALSVERALSTVADADTGLADRIRRLCDLGVDSILVVDALTGDRPHRRRELIGVLSSMGVPVGVQAELSGLSEKSVGRHRSALGLTRGYARKATA